MPTLSDMQKAFYAGELGISNPAAYSLNDLELMFFNRGMTLSVNPPNISSGEEAFNRFFISGAVSSPSQRLRITFTRARKTEPITKLRTITSSTAAGATPTLCRVGVYSIDETTLNGTLITGCVNDTTLWAAANTEYVSTLQSAWNKVAGALYAEASICVTAAAAPTFAGFSGQSGAAAACLRGTPLCAFLDTQPDLPASFTYASLVSSANAVYFEAAP